MISFACRCSYRFSLPEDQAGGMIQCPSCHRLVDVPNLGDLGHIDEEGNYKFNDDGMIPLADEENRLPTLHRVFTRQRVDQDGSDIDLRPTMEDVLQAGTEELAFELAEQIKPSPPKYDPLTGERVKPLDVRPDDQQHIDPRNVPMARRAVNYAAGDLNPRIGILHIGVKLLEPVNLFVMSLIVLVHIFLQPINLLMAAGLFLVVPLWVIGVGLLLSHYGNVIDETGPSARDELPRPLREASLHEDIWQPMTHVVGAFILCYWPILFFPRFQAPLLAGGLGIVGTFFFPAVLLTLATSGTSVNLRPDRIFGVILAIGARYFAIIGLLLLAVTTYGLGLWRFQFDSQRLFMFASSARMGRLGQPWWFEMWVAYPALLVGIYLMHWFCWSLGAAYRAHHEAFPWVYQRHIPTRLRERTQLPPAAAERRGNTNSATVKQKLGGQ
jgi:hypothetical protein